jgi:prohibitin 1
MKKVLGLLSVVLMLSACSIVGPGERGVRFSMGKAQEEVMEPGTHLWVPYFAGSTTFDVQINSIEATTSSGTKDQQEVSTKVTVNLQVDPTKVVHIVKEVGGQRALFDRVSPLIQESVNATISKYSAEEILTKRGQVKADIEALVKERITKYGVIVHDISLKDMQYSAEYAQAIERKQIAEQKAKQAEYETQKAEHDAKAAVATAKGLAEANRMKQATITPQLIQYEAVQRWDGKLPQFHGGGALPFVNVGNGLNK